jgi:outer membrane lipoprotein LolB
MRSPRAFWLALLAMSFVVTAACTRPERPAVEPSADAARRAALVTWEARGRVAVRRDGPDAPGQAQGAQAQGTQTQGAQTRGGQAAIEWQQSGDASRLALRGPFGTGGYRIDAAPGGVTLQTAAGADLRREPDLAAAEEWLAAALGWRFPLGSARFWLLGLADPARPAEVVTDASGRPARLRQGDWEIDYPAWRDVDGLWLPQRLTLVSVADGSGVRVRVVIDRWLLDTAARPIRQ